MTEHTSTAPVPALYCNIHNTPILFYNTGHKGYPESKECLRLDCCLVTELQTQSEPNCDAMWTFICLPHAFKMCRQNRKSSEVSFGFLVQKSFVLFKFTTNEGRMMTNVLVMHL